VSAASAVVTGALAAVIDELRDQDGGALADYIPQLATADPDRFGIALTSVDGHRYGAGDTEEQFTIQSMSKPFVYALALADLGLDEVSRHVAAEPSGEAFNAISLQPDTGRPANPMINAGAIVTTGLIVAASPAERLERIVASLSAFAGRPLSIDFDVYRSEAATGDRNKALAHLARAAGTLPGAVEPTVDVYFRQCAVSVTAADLAVMAATLAAGGVNPVTGQRVVPEPVTEQVLAVMATCGMYDASGEWLLRVGLPAKSGVSGGVIAVSPARFGIAVFSPRLDGAGNSVRGTAALRGLSTRLGLHLMHPVGPGAPTVTTAMTGRATRVAQVAQVGQVAQVAQAAQVAQVAQAAQAGSTAGRDQGPQDGANRHPDAVALALDRHGDQIAVIGAQGVLDFLAAERVMYALDELVPDRPGWIVCDLSRVTRVDPVAAAMLNAMLTRLHEAGHQPAVVGENPPGPWRRPRSLDEALSWAESELAVALP
jgi:glutaminase